MNEQLAEQDREEWLKLSVRQMQAVSRWGWVPMRPTELEDTIKADLYGDDDGDVAVYPSRTNGNGTAYTLRIGEARLRLEMVDGPVNATYRVPVPLGIEEMLQEADYLDYQDTIRSL